MSQFFPYPRHESLGGLLFKDSIARPPRSIGAAPNATLIPLHLDGLRRGLADPFLMATEEAAVSGRKPDWAWCVQTAIGEAAVSQRDYRNGAKLTFL